MSRMRAWRAATRPCCLTVILSAAMAFGAAARADELTVSAAASLTNAFREAGTAFEAQHPGMTVLFNFAASDALLQQLIAGAPVDVLATADQETLDKAEAGQLLADGTRRDFAGNSLVLVTPRDSTVTLNQPGDLAQPAVERIALGNPASVPAGRYAREALESAGMWAAVETKAVYALSVRQALDYVARGEVEAGFVYATDAAVQSKQVRVAFTVPTTSPIVYPLAAIAGSRHTDAARAFVDFVVSPAGQTILARHGFTKP